MPSTVIPKISEKAYVLSKERSTYIFEVPKSANKATVAAQVSKAFEVEVVDVNIANAKGKPKSTANRRRRGPEGRRSDVKRAYVRLKEGQSIPIFASEDEAAEAEAKKVEKAEKAAAKAADKTDKEKK